MPDNRLRDAALRYAALGLKVFPLAPGKKTPLTPNGFHDASNNHDQVLAWWVRWPDANIGVVPGENFVVLDLDVKKGHQGPAVLAALAAAAGDFGEADTDIVVMTPSGGSHKWFQKPPTLNIREGVDALGAGIDVRSVDGYVILPPSVLEDGSRYSFDGGENDGDWMPTMDGRDVPPSPAPDWILKALELKTPKAAKGGKVVPISAQASRHMPDWEVAELRSALSALPPDMGRNSCTLPNGQTHPQGWWHMGAALASLQGKQGFELWNDWSKTGAKYDPAEIVKQWNNLQKRADLGGVTASSLFGLAQQFGWVCPDDILAAKASAMMARPAVTRAELRKEREDDYERLAHEAVETANRESQRVEGVPPELLSPPGLVGELADYIYDHLSTKNRLVAVGCAIQLTATLMARNFGGPTGLRTNLYQIYLGGTGAGKEGVKATMRKMLGLFGIERRLAPLIQTGRSAAIQSLHSEPASVFIHDELGDKLSAAGKAAARGNTLQSDLFSIFKDLYGMTDQSFDGIAYSRPHKRNKDDDDAFRVNCPCPQLVACSTEGQFFEAVKSASLLDGFLNRFTVIWLERPEDDTREPPESIPLSPLPPSLRDWADQLLAVPDLPLTPGMNLVGQSYAACPPTMPIDKDAKDLLAEVWVQSRKLTKKETPSSTIYTRAYEIAHKVAMIIAAGLDTAPLPRITYQAAHWAARWTWYWTVRLAHAAEGRVASNANEALKKAIIQEMKEADPAPMNGLTLTKMLRLPAVKSISLDPNLQRRVIDGMVATGEITHLKNRAKGTRGGRPSATGFYYWASHIDEDDLDLPPPGDTGDRTEGIDLSVFSDLGAQESPGITTPQAPPPGPL